MTERPETVQPETVVETATHPATEPDLPVSPDRVEAAPGEAPAEEEDTARTEDAAGTTAVPADAAGDDGEDGDDAAAAAPVPRPPHVPEKFWDAERGEVRVEALLRSYAELERKLGRMVALPEGPEDVEGRRRLLRALGWPERPEDYDIESPHPLIERDPEVDRRLHEAGFTRDQARLVYELAAERLLPAVAEVVAEAAARRERERLEAHFGGRERFEAVARELRDFAARRLDPDTAAALTSSFEGVLALHRMALAEEPELFAGGEGGGLVPDEDQLVEMMRDPRYWRDRDPEFVAQVTEGFRRLYGD